MNTAGEESDGPGESEMENERDPTSSICFKDTSSNGTDNELDTLMDSTVSNVSCVSSQSMFSASSVNLSLSSDSVQEGTTSDRFIHILVILLLVFCHDLLKTNFCYIVLIWGLLIFTVIAAAAAVLSYHGSHL